MIIDKQYSVSHREVCHLQFNTSRSFSGPHSLSLYTTLLSLSLPPAACVPSAGHWQHIAIWFCLLGPVTKLSSTTSGIISLPREIPES